MLTSYPGDELKEHFENASEQTKGAVNKNSEVKDGKEKRVDLLAAQEEIDRCGGYDKTSPAET